MSFVLSKTAGVAAATGCPPAGVVPDGYTSPFRIDPVSKGVWLNYGQWTDVTNPDVRQGTIPTFTLNYAAIKLVGRSLRYQGMVTMTATPGTASIAVAVVYPVPIRPAGANLVRPIGTGIIYDTSANIYYRGIAAPKDTNFIQFLNTANGTANYLGAVDFTAALATGDQVSWDVEYETT